ncbi:MAG: HlyC/CorC family transporter, partial [Chloroflexi bacterium]|nr:HlyC/CorC family transporter [Chloroflexota bacterium]
GAGRVARMARQPDRLLATILLSNNLVQNAAAALATIVAVSFLGRNQAIVVATIGVTLILVLFGEITPKIIATGHAERMAFLYVRPLETIQRLLSPAVWALRGIGAKLRDLTKAPAVPAALMSEEEIRALISLGAAEGAVAEEEAEMLEKVFRFGDKYVREAMVPRADIIWIEKGTSLADFLRLYAQYSHTRFPVYEESVDNVIGVLSAKDVLLALAKATLDPESPIDFLLRPAHFVPETKRIGELFSEMQRVRSPMAMVVDEFGGTAGLVTLKQLVQVIVGRVEDELVETEREFKAIDEKTIEVDGAMRLEEANEALELSLPPGHYETVAGFVLSALGHIPQVGEQLKHDSVRLVVAEMKGVRIEKILVIRG